MATLATRISRFFNRNRTNRRPVAIDIFTARRAEPAEVAVDSLRQMSERPAPGHEDAEQPKRGLLSRIKGEMPGAKRDQAIADLKAGYDEVVDLMKTVRTHLNDQSERSQHLLELLRHMPEALQSLPETNRNQSRLLEVIQNHLDQQSRHATRFNDSLTTLTRVTEQQTQILGVIQQHMDASSQTDDKLLRSFTAMNQTLENLNDSTRLSANNMRELNERAAADDRRMQQMMEKTGRQMTVLSITSWIMAAIALGVAVYAITSMG